MSLIDDLRKAAKEIADAGHNGWGNLCSDAATALERQGYVNDGLSALIADDAYAATFQSIGQYRSALLSKSSISGGQG